MNRRNPQIGRNAPAAVRFCSLVALVLLAAAGCRSEERPRRLDPQGAALLGQAQQAFRQGAYTRSLTLVDSAAQYMPDLPDVWFLRGRVLGDMYRFDESDAAYEKALDLDPTYRSAHYHLGHNAFLQSSNAAMDGFRKALRHYKTEEGALRKTIGDGRNISKEDRDALATVLLQIGTTYRSLNRPDSAMLACRKALELDTTLAKGYAWLAGVHHSEGRAEEALANARRASEIDPANAEYTLLIGVLLNGLERYEEALPYLSEAAHKTPWNRTAIYSLGTALTANGREDEGSTYLARADSLEILRARIERAHMGIFHEPDNPIRWENYAFLLHQAGQHAEAVRALGVMRNLMQAGATLPDDSTLHVQK